MKQITIAFVWAIVLSLLVGLALATLLFWLDWPWWYWPTMTTSYTLWVSWRDAHDLLGKRLGRREQGYGVKRTGRRIPISLDVGAVFEAVLPGRLGGKSKYIEVDNGYTLVSPVCQVGEGVANEFIRLSQIRYERGKKPFSRMYWTTIRRPPLSREQYDCIMVNLADFGFISGRRQGRSGELNAHSEKIIQKLRLNLK